MSDNNLDWINNSNTLADLLNDLTTLYGYAEHNDLNGPAERKLPVFIRQAFGNPLRSLHSIAAERDQVQKSEGIGKFVDAVHREMRGYAFNLSKTFMQTFKEHGIDKIPPPRCPFIDKLGKLGEAESANVTVEVNGQDIKFEVKGRQIALRGLTFGIAAGGLTSRGEEEFLKMYTDTGIKTYERANRLRFDVVEALKEQHPEYAELSEAELNLDLKNTKLMAAKAVETAPQARLLYNLYVILYQEPSSVYKAWAGSVEAKPDNQRFYLSTPADIAVFFYSVFAKYHKAASGMEKKFTYEAAQNVKQIADEIANAADFDQACAMLRRPLCREMLERISKLAVTCPSAWPEIAETISNLQQKGGYPANRRSRRVGVKFAVISNFLML